jgi:hypothetical protein
MAGAPADLPAGIRLIDHISLGVIARAFPPERVRRILTETGPRVAGLAGLLLISEPVNLSNLRDDDTQCSG